MRIPLAKPLQHIKEQTLGLLNTQYAEIMRKYDQIQLDNAETERRRQEEVFAAIPAYETLHKQLSSLCVSRTKQLLMGNDAALASLKEEIRALSQKKEELLVAAGFPKDYLDPIYTCPDCKDTGYLPDRSKCLCLKRNIVNYLYNQSNLSDVLYRENFDTLETKYYNGKDLENYNQILAKCHNFVSGFNSGYQNLFIYGTVGTGKTFLSNCIAKELLDKGHSVIYFSAPKLFDILIENRLDEQKGDAYLNDFYDCDLLIIDDLGTECTNRLTTSELFTCINERALRKKATIISSNLQLGELTDRYSERVFSRITSGYELLKVTGPDIRIAKKLAQ